MKVKPLFRFEETPWIEKKNQLICALNTRKSPWTSSPIESRKNHKYDKLISWNNIEEWINDLCKRTVDQLIVSIPILRFLFHPNCEPTWHNYLYHVFNVENDISLMKKVSAIFWQAPKFRLLRAPKMQGPWNGCSIRSKEESYATVFYDIFSSFWRKSNWKINLYCCWIVSMAQEKNQSFKLTSYQLFGVSTHEHIEAGRSK